MIAGMAIRPSDERELSRAHTVDEVACPRRQPGDELLKLGDFLGTYISSEFQNALLLILPLKPYGILYGSKNVER